MKDVLRFAIIGSACCAMMGAAGSVRAQTVLMSNLSNGSFTFGNETFTITGCTLAGSSSCAPDGASIYTVLNGRGGTEIEIAGTSGVGSAIYSETTSGTGSYNLNFNLQVTPTAASGGLSKITDTLTGTATTSGGNSDVFASVTGTSPAFSKIQSIIGTNAPAQSFSLVKFGTATTSATFAVNLDVTATTGQILKLTNVALLFNPAPEPASIALLGSGLAGLAAARRRFMQRSKSEHAAKS